MSQYAELKAQIARLQAQADEARRTELGNVIEDIRSKIAEYGLTAQDLGFAAPPGGAPAEEGAVAAEVSGSEIGQYMERAGQAAELDCR